MGIEAEVSRKIYADSDAIWELLADPTSWSSWWTDCEAARSVDGKVLREGSGLEVVLQPKIMKLTLTPEVGLLSERKLLSLTHRSAMIHSTVTWQLAEKKEFVVVTADIVFNGVLPFLIAISQQSSIVRFSLTNNLKGLKRAAEQRY